MRFIDLRQGSTQWLAWRRGGLGASDALAISGIVPPWDNALTPYRLWSLKTGRAPEPESTFAMRRGQRLEPVARQMYRERTGRPIEPCCVQHDRLDWLRASLDGLDEWGERIVEIKAPNEKAHRCALEGSPPDYYLPQLLHQCAATGIATVDYVSISEHKAFGEKDRLAVVSWTPDLDRRDLRRLVEQEAQFWMRVVFDYWPVSEIA